MGLFDNVLVKHPDYPELDDNYQTKDFECRYLNLYIITEAGRLVFQPGGFREDMEPVDQNFHGILNFYTIGEDDEWLEYNAKFTDGQLVSIRVVSGK